MKTIEIVVAGAVWLGSAFLTSCGLYANSQMSYYSYQSSALGEEYALTAALESAQQWRHKDAGSAIAHALLKGPFGLVWYFLTTGFFEHGLMIPGTVPSKLSMALNGTKCGSGHD